jgi:hypothetical protein
MIDGVFCLLSPHELKSDPQNADNSIYLANQCKPFHFADLPLAIFRGIIIIIIMLDCLLEVGSFFFYHMIYPGYPPTIPTQIAGTMIASIGDRVT